MDFISEIKKILTKGNIDEPNAECNFILKTALNLSSYNIIFPNNVPINLQKKAIDIAKTRVLTRKPLAYIIGKTHFMGYDFFVDSSVLIPRDETEILVNVCKNLSFNNLHFKLLDLCTGSGIIAIILKKLLNCCVTASDISFDALNIAKKNAASILKNENNINFINSDLFENIYDKFDLIVSNPPYIPIHIKDNLQNEVKNFEPHISLFANDNLGIDFYIKIINQSIYYLNNNGYLAFELGIGQYKFVYSIMEKYFKNIKIYKDLNNIERVIVGQIK